MDKDLNWLNHIKAISLDWGDTLAHVVGKDQRLYNYRLLTKTLLKLNPELDLLDTQEKSKKISFLTHQTYHKNFNKEELQWTDCNISEIIVPLVVEQFPFINDCLELFKDGFCTQDNRILCHYQGLEDILQIFKNRGWKIGLLSHVNYEEKYVKRNLEENNILEYFDSFSLSGDIKKTKPHPDHFNDFLNKVNCQPHEVLHMGDHPIKDIVGATKMGFHTAFIYEPGNYPMVELKQAEPHLYITSIFEMKAVFEELQCNPSSTFFSDDSWKEKI
ncbi:MAG: hypothetical protein COA79_03345 [Planctomycetota bacterium]|nr:MAG: hypothetical protein COA79_03345 [Planctomycetota bacterium]